MPITKKELARERLYSAVQEYIEEHGGSVVVIGGIAIVKEPSDAKQNYGLMIRCTGILPTPSS